MPQFSALPSLSRELGLVAIPRPPGYPMVPAYYLTDPNTIQSSDGSWSAARIGEVFSELEQLPARGLRVFPAEKSRQIHVPAMLACPELTVKAVDEDSLLRKLLVECAEQLGFTLRLTYYSGIV